MSRKKESNMNRDEIYELFTKNAILHDKPIAIITMGIPGSGKSTIVKKFINKNIHKIIPRKQKYSYKEFVNCNPDEFLKFVDEEDPKKKLGLASRKNASLLKKVRESELKFSIIYDGTGANFSSYKGNINKFIENGYFPILIYVKTNPIVAKNRIKKRSRKVSNSNVDRIFEKLEEDIENKETKQKMKKYDYYRSIVVDYNGIYIVIDNTFRGKIMDSNVSNLEI